MLDPFNMLPVDPKWVAEVDRISKMASKRLGCMVCIVAMQPDGGKVCASIEGVPESGDLAAIAAEGPGRILELLAVITTLQDAVKGRE